MKDIPVLLLTGYLGSGKTTLVNRILSDNRGIKFAVIVNDIGEVNTDDESKERLVWVDEKSDITYYPTFFREELKHPSNTVKHIVTDNRK